MLVEIRDLSKYYGGTAALNNVSLNIEQGMFGLLGPNGAGKSTLMRILATLLEPTSGQVTVDNLDVLKNKRAIRAMLGYLPQEFGLYKKLNAMEFLDLVADLKEIPRGQTRRVEIERVLKQVNMWEYRKQRASGYSGGMKRRIGIAQAIIGDPKLLIVDEPTAGLDPEERLRFRNILGELSVNRIVILSTHVVADIENSCNQLAILVKGKLIFSGDRRTLMKRADGKVWEVTVPEREVKRFGENIRVLSTRKEGDLYTVRYIGKKGVLQDAITVPATLEDGYMIVVERGITIEDSAVM